MNNNADDIRARDAVHAEQVIREVCDEFKSALESAASGAVSARYAAVPSWYASGTVSRPTRPYPAVPSWCIDATTARRLLREEDQS
jgi:hypothetical protein